MKPLKAVALFCLILAANAHPENIEQVKELPQSKEPIVEAEESDPQARIERCTTCSGGLKIRGQNDILAAIQALPGAEVHTQQSFEECSSDKGCAGIKVKDGRVVEKFGTADSFKAAAAANTGNDFTFHAAGTLGNGVLAPFWWMNQNNSPFKAGEGNFKEFSQSSQSSYSGAAPSGAGIELAANPFLNGEFSKIAGGFSGGAQAKPSTFQSSSFESSSFSTSGKAGEVDISKNPFLNGGVKIGQGFQGQEFQSGAAGGSQGFANQGFSAQSGYNSGKISGYTGSSPSPFTASTGGSNVNLIQSSQKVSELDFESQQQNIDEAFQGTGNVHAHEHSGGELQQTCAGQGYVCVHKAQCNNGVVNTNGANILQARTKKQYCNTKTEICCRIEVSTLAGAGGLQGSLGVGSATFSGQGSGSQQGSGLFVSSSGQSGQGSSQFGQSGQGSGQFGQSGQAGFGSNTNTFESSSTVNRASFGQGSSGQGGFGNGGSAQGAFGANSGTAQFGANSGSSQFGATGSSQFSGSSGSFGSNSGSGFQGQGQSTFGAGTGSGSTVNRVETSQTSFESSRGGQAFGGNNAGKFGATGSSGTFSGTGFAATTPTNRFGSNSNSINNNEVTYKQTSQTNFVETDSFSAGSEADGIYRPGQPNGLKPGIPYLPPIDNTNSGSSVVSSTASTFSTSRPFTTPKPTYLPPPPPSTSAPGYLPPVEGEQSILTETRLPQPPTYDEGQIILDESRQPNRPRQPTTRPPPPIVGDIPSGCAAALKCTPIEYCTAEGVISNTTVILSKDAEAYRVPLTDCKDLESGRPGKCCRDPTYTDPWPTNQLGKWVPGVFGGNDGKYVADSRGSGNNARPVTARPPVTGSVLLNNFRTPKPTIPPYGPNQVTPGYGTTTVNQGSYTQKGQGQYSVGGQGQYTQGGQGQYTQGGQGQYTQGGQGQYTQGGQGQYTQGGQGQYTQGGQGQYTQGGQGQFAVGGQGQVAQGGQGQYTQGSSSSQFSQSTFGQKGQGQLVSQGQGQLVSQGQGQLVSQGQGQIVSRGQGQAVTQGQGQYTSQGQGQFAQGGRGQYTTGGQGQLEIQGQGAQSQFSQTSQSKFSQTSQGQGQGVITGQGQGVITGQGQGVITGQGQAVSQGFGSGFRQGSGFSVSQGGGFGIENEYSESVQRVFLQQYNGNGQCGLLNGQKPFGNRNENEVDFAEIPWQAMVLLQTNKSLLCGGVITRPDVVITSASCVDGLIAKNVLIKGGEWKLGIDDEPLPFQIVQVKTILRHPYYKRGNANYDAAILVLSENLRFAKNIYPICLPRAEETLDAFYNGAGECIVTGWGKQVLQAHLAGSIMHSINVSLLNPGECQAKLSSDYPHLLSQYDQESCACGQPTNPVNNICRVDIGSALACTTDDRHYVLRGVYSWDSGCQPGNQLAAFYKFDVEWYEWAIGLIESVRFAQFGGGAQTSQRFSGQIKGQGSQFGSGIKGSKGFASKGQFGFGQGQIVSGGQATSGGRGQIVSGGQGSISSSNQGQYVSGGQSFASGQSQFSSGGGRGQAVSGGIGSLISEGVGKVVSGGQGSLISGGQGFSTSGQFGQFSSGKYSSGESAGLGFGSQIKAPITNSFSASYSEKKVFQSEPKIVTFTTKPEIVTFTTKPEYFTYTTKPKIVTYTTKPQFITYETSGSGTNPQYVAPEVSFNPSFRDVTKSHVHSANCKCEGKK